MFISKCFLHLGFCIFMPPDQLRPAGCRSASCPCGIPTSTPDLCDSWKQQNCWRGSQCVPENTATVMFSSRAVWSVSFSLRMLVNATYYCFIETDMSANVEQLVTLSGVCTPAEGGYGYITAVITKAVVCSCNVLKKQWFCVVELLLHGIFLYAKCFISVSTFNIMHKMHCGRSCREVLRLPQQ